MLYNLEIWVAIQEHEIILNQLEDINVYEHGFCFSEPTLITRSSGSYS